MHKVIFMAEGKQQASITVNDRENLLEAARKAGIIIDTPCNGNGTCGKCKVRIAEGSVRTTDNGQLTEEEKANGWVLACMSEVTEDVEVEIPALASAFKNAMQITDLSENESKNIRYVRKKLIGLGMTEAKHLEKLRIQLPEPTVDDNLADEDRLRRYFSQHLGFTDILLSLNILRRLPDAFRENNFQVDVVFRRRPHQKAEILDVYPAREEERVLYGIALDIGTTSVSACLVNLATYEIVAKASMGNGQVKFGGDVINRIVYAEKPGGLSRLRRAIIDETINPLIMQLVASQKITTDDVYEMCAAGNTTMTHLLLGVNPDYLRREPFIPAVSSVPEMKSTEIGISINPEGRIYLAPSVASYVGGDITAGVFAVPVWMQDEFTMLVDLGTNGEIVFGNKDFMMTCACSAGPAFEGGEITCGTRAVPGAVEEVKIDGDTLKASYKTIGEKDPVGICGSGIIDLICEMKRTGIIDGKGRIKREIDNPRIAFDEYDIGRYYLANTELDGVASDIYITEIDIDSFIKAKGAVFSAIQTLMESMDMPIDILDSVYVAGGIGSNLGIENAIALGMLPDIPVEKYYYIGNSSMQGCYLALTLAEGRDKIAEIASNMTYMELSVHPSYMDAFVSACFIPHTDLSLFPSLN